MNPLASCSVLTTSIKKDITMAPSTIRSHVTEVGSYFYFKPLTTSITTATNTRATMDGVFAEGSGLSFLLGVLALFMVYLIYICIQKRKEHKVFNLRNFDSTQLTSTRPTQRSASSIAACQYGNTFPKIACKDS